MTGGVAGRVKGTLGRPGALSRSQLRLPPAGRDHEATVGDSTPILLVSGTGASDGDVAALQNILTREHLSYSTTDPQRLQQMAESQMRGYRLLIVPGRDFELLGAGLTTDRSAKIRYAIHRV